MSAFQPSANTAAAIGLFTTLLAVDDPINIEQTFARPTLRLRNIAVGDRPLFAVLALDETFYLLLTQPETGTDLSVCFSCGVSPEHLFAKRLYFLYIVWT